MISIDFDKCDNCNLCFQACMAESIDKGPEVKKEAGVLCIECGHCYAACPRDAITVLGYEDVETRPLPEEKPVSGEAMMALLRGRRSARGFRKGLPVPEEDLRALIEAASIAPSRSQQPPLESVRHTATPRPSRRCAAAPWPTTAGWRRSSSHAPSRRCGSSPVRTPRSTRSSPTPSTNVTTDHDGKDILFYDAPCLLIITAPRLNSMAQGDAWLASENALLYAESIGVATCFSGFLIMAVNWDLRLRRIMRIPAKERVVGALMVGYARRDWKREAPRKPLPTVWR